MNTDQENKFEKLLTDFFNEVMPSETDKVTRSRIIAEVEDKFDDVAWQWLYGKASEASDN